jgi:ribosomal protein S12 methylthiotransferase
MRTKGTDKVNIITLGCSKNLVDSEVLLHQLQSGGIDSQHQAEDEEANVIIVNTCGFIDRAKEESIQTILQYAQAKEQGDIDKLYVTGCLSQRYKDELALEIPEVDAWFGTLDLPDLLRRFEVNYRHELLGERQPTTPRHYAYLKISEGCNRTCSFCAIPLMRGGHVSRPIEELASEARSLVRQGIKEVMLIAQELTYYGLDLYKKRALSDLLKALATVEGLHWIRLHYAYPSKFPLDVLEVMAEYPTICNYLDMPLQHASDRVLQAMKRQITRKETEALIADARRLVPGIALRTTMLVGFPGETEADFEELMDFVAEQRFDRLGVFTYSHEEGTSGFDLADDVPQEVKEDRARRLMELQEEISEALNQRRVGQTETVLVDRIEGDWFVARSERDSPEVDNEVLISAANHFLRIGDFVPVRIDRAEAFDLYATPIGSSGQDGGS